MVYVLHSILNCIYNADMFNEQMTLKELNMKNHLKHTVHFGPTCQSGRSGGSLRGEHFTYPAADFLAMPSDLRCAKCEKSKLFAFLQRQAAKKGA